MKKRVVVIGFGRFGQLLADILRSDCDVTVLETDPRRSKQAVDTGYKTITLEQIGDCEAVFIAVPISSFEEVVQSIAPFVRSGQLVSDLCSVKVYPAKIMKQYLGHCQIMACHPLFGPDSASNGLTGLKLVLCRLRVQDEPYQFWRDFWIGKGVDVIETTPEAHDRDTVYSQAFTYVIARIVREMELPDLQFTIRSYGMLKQVAELLSRDSEQLFHDVLCYNPYFSEMKAEFEQSTARVVETLDAIEVEVASKDKH